MIFKDGDTTLIRADDDFDITLSVNSSIYTDGAYPKLIGNITVKEIDIPSEQITYSDSEH